MKENGREEEKREKMEPFVPKVSFMDKKSPFLQCVQMAYIATKTRKITQINKSN